MWSLWESEQAYLFGATTCSSFFVRRLRVGNEMSSRPWTLPFKPFFLSKDFSYNMCHFESYFMDKLYLSNLLALLLLLMIFFDC